MPSWNKLNEKAKEWNKERRNRPVNALLTQLTTEDIESKILEAETTENPVRKIKRFQAASKILHQKRNSVKAKAGIIVEQRSRGAYFKFMGKAYVVSLLAMAIPIMIFVPPIVLLPAAVLFAPVTAFYATKFASSIIGDKENWKQKVLLAQEYPKLDGFGDALSALENDISQKLEATQKTCNLTEAFNSLSPDREQRKEFLAENQILRERLKTGGFIVAKKPPKQFTPATPGGSSLWAHR